ncbi:MAG: tetratricopeptide repeat protein, partial [Patescibacteria group bacterium]
MWYNLIPLFLIFICGIVIIYIITKKFPAVANLDLANLPQEKEKKVKQRIISNRIKRNINSWKIWLKKIFRPIFSFIGSWLNNFYKKLLSARDNLARKSEGDDVSEIDELFLEAEEHKKEEKYDEAEKIYIRIISLDSKNVSAFKMLGQLYLTEGKTQEAKETLEHVLKLTKEDADVYSNLAEVSKENGQLERAKKHYTESIKLNSENAQNYFNLAEIQQSLNNSKEAMKNM